MNRRERMVMVDPRGTGMVLITLRATDEVRAPQFTSVDGAIDAEMLAIARAIVAQRTGKFEPNRFRDRYQEALRELIEAKMKGVAIKPRAVATPAPVIDLMAALKRSLAQGTPTGALWLKNAPKRHPIGARGRYFCQCPAAGKRRKSRRPSQPQSPGSDERRLDGN
jgi:DNA end-binding protein Ku